MVFAYIFTGGCHSSGSTPAYVVAVLAGELSSGRPKISHWIVALGACTSELLELCSAHVVGLEIQLRHYIHKAGTLATEPSPCA